MAGASLRVRCGAGFTLIELAVVVAVIGALVALLLPALASAGRSARGAVCLGNLRQNVIACELYAMDHDGFGPAIGSPWTSSPNWAIVVLDEMALSGAADPYVEGSTLVCPEARRWYGRPMTRTQAMNATGHAGAEGDRDSYDDPSEPAHIRMSHVSRPSDTLLLMDSAVAFIPDDAPPPTRTASVVDFRNAGHIEARLGWFHAEMLHGGRFDGSAGAHGAIEEHWDQPLP